MFSSVLPRFKFLNLMVVLAAPRACFMMEKDRTFHGSPSISTVRPFLMSDVSMATFRAVVLVGREAAAAAAAPMKGGEAGGEKALAEVARRASRRAAVVFIVGWLLAV